MSRRDSQSTTETGRAWILGQRGQTAVLDFLRVLRAGQLPRGCVTIWDGATAPEVGPADWVAAVDSAVGEAGLQRALDQARGAAHWILNADDPAGVRTAQHLDGTCIWIATDPRNPQLLDHLDRGGEACFLDGFQLTLGAGGAREAVGDARRIPALLGGAARRQVRALLTAMALALGLDSDLEELRRGCRAMQDPHCWPLGSITSRSLAGARLILDQAQDGEALEELAGLLAELPAERLRVFLGQAPQPDPVAVARALERLPIAELWLADDQAWGCRDGEPELLRYAHEGQGLRDFQQGAKAGDLLVLLRCTEQVAKDALD